LVLKRSTGVEANLALPAPIVAAGRALAETPAAQLADRRAQLVERPHRAILADRKAILLQPVLLLNPVLNDRQHRAARAHRRKLRRRRHARWRNLLDLERDHIASPRQVRGLPRIVPPCL